METFIKIAAVSFIADERWIVRAAGVRQNQNEIISLVNAEILTKKDYEIKEELLAMQEKQVVVLVEDSVNEMDVPVIDLRDSTQQSKQSDFDWIFDRYLSLVNAKRIFIPENHNFIIPRDFRIRNTQNPLGGYEFRDNKVHPCFRSFLCCLFAYYVPPIFSKYWIDNFAIVDAQEQNDPLRSFYKITVESDLQRMLS